MANTFASALDLTARPQAPINLASAARQALSLGGLRLVLETWEERKRIRLQLEDMLLTAPHLIEDIGLNRKQVVAEITKPFWRE